MGKLQVRFEQHRGLVMVIGNESGFNRESINWTQVQMLKRCEVPGLLPIELDELNGAITLKYELSGSRMLGEALRVSKWTMVDLMGALCRLSEVLEDCRLYLLDAERIMLADEFIYVGGDWHDLRFTYLPLHEAVNETGGTLERLVVRWMMRVDELDGGAMQRLLQIIASPDFVPHALRSYVRQYLNAGMLETSNTSTMNHSPSLSMMQGEMQHASVSRLETPPQGTDKPRGARWRLLQPPSGDPHTLSELIGEEKVSWGGSGSGGSHADYSYGGDYSSGTTRGSIRPAMDPHRRRTIMGSIAAVTVAASWKFGYLGDPGNPAMLLCASVTLLAIASVWLLWSGTPKWLAPISQAVQSEPRRRNRQSIHTNRGEGFFNENSEEDPSSAPPRFPIHVSEQRKAQAIMAHADAVADLLPREAPAETRGLSSRPDNRTEMLGFMPSEPQTSCYLIWDTKGDGQRIILGGESIVIGRSSDVAKHVDESAGISRAHVELIHIDDQWKAKDLGSRNGSRLNDIPMTPYQLYPLQSGDNLTLAGSKYRFVQEGA